MDFLITLTAQWTNPYRGDEIRLDLNVVSPGGNHAVVPAYFERGNSGALSVWKARFTPSEAGEYTGVFVLINAGQQSASKKLAFAVSPSKQKGFLHGADAWTFRFDDGEAFRGLGENIGWESRSSDDSRYFRGLHENPRYNYEYLLGRLATNGGNFFRTWMCPWNLPLEWKKISNSNRYTDDDGYFNASAIQRMDQLVELAGSLNLYMMLTLDNSVDFQGRSWQRSSYNRANGGPAASTQEFFTDPRAKSQYKDRLRYLVARWGYSPHIAAWEFFNEIDNLMYGIQPRISDEIITAWHREMSDYLKSIDPYHHLVTTSISHRDVAGLDSIPSIDFNQKHIYGHNGRSQIALFPETLYRYSRQARKPYVIGEYGVEWDWNKNFDDFADKMDGDFKEGLWLGLFSPTPILPMSWWWEYFDNRGLTSYFAKVGSMLNKMLAAGRGAFAGTECKWESDQKQTQALAVRCGRTFFVLLANDGASPDTGSISLPLESSRHYRVCSYDPARDATEVLPPLAVGARSIGGISIASVSTRILVISP
jgi:hypothetical protein